MGYAIRPAGEGDAARIAAMANRLARVTAGLPGAMTPDMVMRDLIDGAGLGVIVADIGGDAIAYALYAPAYETVHAARGLYLTDLYVMEEYRRRGIARALMAELARISAAQGGRYLWWVSHAGNVAAKAFYDRLGAVTDPIEARAVFEAPFETLLAEGL